MDDRTRNAAGMGMVVGILAFFIIYYKEVPFGQMDFLGSLGTAFGFGFGVAMANYVMKQKNE